MTLILDAFIGLLGSFVNGLAVPVIFPLFIMAFIVSVPFIFRYLLKL